MRWSDYILGVQRENSIDGISYKKLKDILNGTESDTVDIINPTIGCIMIKYRNQTKISVLKCVGEYYTNSPDLKKLKVSSNKSCGNACYDVKSSLGIPNYICTCVQCHLQCLSRIQNESKDIFRIRSNKKK